MTFEASYHHRDRKQNPGKDECFLRRPPRRTLENHHPGRRLQQDLQSPWRLVGIHFDHADPGHAQPAPRIQLGRKALRRVCRQRGLERYPAVSQEQIFFRWRARLIQQLSVDLDRFRVVLALQRLSCGQPYGLRHCATTVPAKTCILQHRRIPAPRREPRHIQLFTHPEPNRSLRTHKDTVTGIHQRELLLPPRRGHHTAHPYPVSGIALAQPHHAARIRDRQFPQIGRRRFFHPKRGEILRESPHPD